MHSEHFFEYRGRLFFRRYENKGRPALLCIHGFNDTSATFEFILPALLPHFELTALDLRGHGQSDALSEGYYSSATLLGDLARFTGEVMPEKYSLLGHSLGAGLCARWCGMVPEEVESLVLLEGFGGLISPEKELCRMREWIKNLRRFKGVRREKLMTIAEARQRLSWIHTRAAPEQLDFLVQTLTREQEGGMVSWHQDGQLKANFVPVPFPFQLSRKLWQEINCPVLLLFGSHTQFRPGASAPDKNKSESGELYDLPAEEAMREILSHFKDIRYAEIEEAGHNMHHDRPERVMRHISLFYQEKCPQLLK